ncbi:MAG: hypothetical protein GYA55_03455 [SAR324 cluster bacterium]|uniref:Lipoprotein n=1 Tax=SAR324 cluster bacterium TaxID=2024889 RepID=A0A7X9IJK0_9DELT|nr:hypothetical protein [SAR324 cluster bacterium]
MRQKLFQILVYLGIGLAISACGTNPSPPAVLNVALERGSVPSGTTNSFSSSYRISADKVNGEYRSQPFFSVIRIPAGASYVEGTSHVLFQSNREPDSKGLCADGSSFLSFNFSEGEFISSNKTDPFIGVIVLKLLLQSEADKELVRAEASDSPIDPCGSLDDSESVMLRVYGN